MNAYANPAYVESLSEFGESRLLPHCGGAVLMRQIPGTPERDATGGYPLFACKDWSKLHMDLDEIGEELVSLAVVADPHGRYEVDDLHRSFDVVVPFKEHYVVELDRPPRELGSSGHRRKAARALRDVEVEMCADPAGFLDDWCALYDVLKERHGITGIRAYSRDAFMQQLNLSEVVVLKALHQGELAGALIFLLHAGVAYGHLYAQNETGYRLRATYALDRFSFDYFSGKARLIDLGGGRALAGTNGLGDYKRGWATGTRPVYFCGRVLNRRKYESITEARGLGKTNYFPAYRYGEFS